MGDLSAARNALEGAELAPGNRNTLEALRDPEKRPERLRRPIPPALLELRGEAFRLDRDRFLQVLRTARKGAAGGVSGMTAEHLRPMLESPVDSELLFHLASDLAEASIPEEVLQVIRLGRMTAFRKASGGVRGIVAGDILRRLVARTMCQQLGPAIEAATAPFQYALTTQSGCECVAHAIQALTDINDSATVMSVDGIGAFDLVSRESMLAGLTRVTGGPSALPFVRPSVFLWEDDEGNVHDIVQGEGGEQGDPFMPALYSLEQHGALVATQETLDPAERDSSLSWTTSTRFLSPSVLEREMWRHAGIRLYLGKTQMCRTRVTFSQSVCESLVLAGRAQDPPAEV